MADITLGLLDAHKIPWEVVERWGGPIWTGERFMFEQESYGDLGRFHEFMHYCVADEWQLTLPDFGLGRNSNGAWDWRSSVWPSSAHDWGNVRFESSWSDEDRVEREDAGIQEAYAIWAMGLYLLLNPEASEAITLTMDDFGAWSKTGLQWTEKHNREIVDLVVDPIGIENKDVAVACLEHYRGKFDGEN